MNGNFDPYTFNMMLNMMNMIHSTMGFNQMNYNNNNYNNQDLWNMMNIQMNNNHALVQVYNNMNQFNNNMNQFNNNMNQFNFNQNNTNMNQFNNSGFSHSNNEEIKVDGGAKNSNELQGGKFNLCQNDNELRRNLVFTTQKGQKMTITTPSSMKVKDLLVQYVLKNGLGPRVINGNIFFIYNGLRIDQNEDKSVGEFFIGDFVNIIVMDTKNILGA